MPKIDDALLDWSDLLVEDQWGTIVIGNGASINLWPRFGYQSLLEAARLDQNAKAAFSAFDTKNFETVLSGLAQTRKLLEALGKDVGWADATYGQVRDGLFDAVRSVHVPWQRIGQEAWTSIATHIDSARQVFTINYDLILYWARLHPAVEVNIVDFFWSQDCCFNIANTRVRAGATALYNLHGGLHLWHDARTGTTGKVRRSERRLLDTLQECYGPESSKQPLFVSEGLAADKLRAIRGSDYLTFAYRALLDDGSPTVIFGSSLGASDAHIVEAIDRGRKKRIAVSMFRGSLSCDQVIECKARVAGLFPRHRVSFFDATTHPLGAPALRVGPAEAGDPPRV